MADCCILRRRPTEIAVGHKGHAAHYHGHWFAAHHGVQHGAVGRQFGRHIAHGNRHIDCGANNPLVTVPTGFPHGVQSSTPSRTGTRSCAISPTRFLEGFCATTPVASSTSSYYFCSTWKSSCACTAAAPHFLNRPGQEASSGSVLVSMSWPYRHSPASRRRELRAPSPIGLTSGCASKARASASALSTGTEISKPSSPV